MAIFNQLSGVSTSNGMDLPFKNYTGSDIPQGTAVKLDTGNIGDTNKPQGVVQTTSDVGCIGFAFTLIPAGKLGTVRVGGAAVAIAGAATTVGDYLMSNASGQVVTQTAGLKQIGMGLTAATAPADPILVLISQAKNA